MSPSREGVDNLCLLDEIIFHLPSFLRRTHDLQAAARSL